MWISSPTGVRLPQPESSNRDPRPLDGLIGSPVAQCGFDGRGWRRLEVILPDVNVLVYAYRADLDQHETYRPWLSKALGGPEPFGAADAVLTGFMRVVTNRRIFANPSPIQAALSFVVQVRSAPATRAVMATDATWREFARFAESDSRVAGNLVPDAWLAALAVSVGARLATADAGFARFEGLRWFDPQRSASA